MSHYTRYLPWAILAVTVVYLGIVMNPGPSPGKMHMDDLARVPILDHGRIKPLDTLARVNLMIISGRQTYRDESKEKQPAIRWLMDVMTSGKSHPSAKVKAFRLDDEKIRSLIDVPERTDHLYSYDEIAGSGAKLVEELKARMARGTDGQSESADVNLKELYQQLFAYSNFSRYETTHKVFRIENLQLLALLGLEPREGYRYGFDEFVPRIYFLIKEAKRIDEVPPKERSAYEAKLIECSHHVTLHASLAEMRSETLRVIPPDRAGGDWKSYEDALSEVDKGAKPSAALVGFAKMQRSYEKGEADAFNSEAADYRKLVADTLPGPSNLSRFETFFNEFEPFYHCSVLYVVMFVLACASWVVLSQELSRSAFWLGVLILAMQSWAILARMYIQDRPPVTNLYSSAIFVGWVCIAMGLLLEWFFPYGIASAAASLLGFTTSIFAHHLAASGDTLEMMQAVLDTNFWLATHVVAVNIGYGATLFAGVFGALYILRGLIGTNPGGEIMRNFSTMLYGILCFATLFSFVGTVLGGIWAADSWGRFWGWDPKENGALIIVIWNALILHARWAGLVKHRGIAVLSVVGIMVTGWSWIGTNQLGVGLHAYGFNNTLAAGLVATWAICLGVIAAGLVPLRYWRGLAVRPADGIPPTIGARKRNTQ
jgi:ABC-type transport system involved in cytochrome c biogenesis permease subunit